MQVITITRTIKVNLAAERRRLSRQLAGEQRDRVLGIVDAFAANDLKQASKRFIEATNEDCRHLNAHVCEALQEAALQEARQSLDAVKRPLRSIATVTVN